MWEIKRDLVWRRIKIKIPLLKLNFVKGKNLNQNSASMVDELKKVRERETWPVTCAKSYAFELTWNFFLKKTATIAKLQLISLRRHPNLAYYYYYYYHYYHYFLKHEFLFLKANKFNNKDIRCLIEKFISFAKI
ncbi:hypothetical protein BpHYR1_019893 [Brachionus plicatilis]|uniref:Uncharacterized protein n=1 Tax=Brachionus plicatilis TaxID=10195 RepID=A0A3M7T8U5_BRAPC|nr:hypothetical protein BpHYR1_019893 [Brachionus plicatilis]